MSARNGSVVERFWAKVDRSGDCWVWTANKVGTGYGRFWSGSPSGVLAHRWIWEQHNGAIPKGMEVMHKCDTPSCVRVDHLQLGTHAENVADCVAKDRTAKPKGERNPFHRLKLADVHDIRVRIARGEVQRRIAEDYGVSPSAITAVKKGQNWSWAT